MKKIFLPFITSTLFLAACQQQPFPQKGGDILPAEEKPAPVAPAFSIEVNDIVPCEEAQECITPMVGHVPNGGTPQITFENLPDGATFDATEGKIHYTPDYSVVDVAKDPTQTSISLPVTAILHVAGDAVTTYRKTFTFEVKNTVRPVTLTTSNPTPTLTEGRTFRQKITLNSEDFPNGPFYLNFQNQPLGLKATVDADDPHVFELEYTPGFDVVTTADDSDYNGHYSKAFNMSILVGTPNGQSSAQAMTWTVSDARQAPHVSYPTDIRQGPIVNYTIRAEDPNGEEVPTIDVDTDVPYGTLTAEEIERNDGQPGVSLPSIVYNVIWKDIPYDKVGKTQNIVANVCGPSSQWNSDNCTRKTTRVQIDGNSHPAPRVTRTQWPVAKTFYLKAGARSTVALSVADAEDNSLPVTVEILPASMQSMVKYKSGSLEITAPTPGVQQFTVKATSQFQQSTVESFIFEALPSDWSDTVILTGGTITPEISGLRDILKKGDLLSSVFQVDERNLQLRSTLIVTTAALAEKDALPYIEKAAASVKNVIVLSPLAANAGHLKNEFTGLGAQIADRIKEPVTNFTVAVDAKSGLQAPAVPLGLKGSTTSESAQPLTIDAGTGRKCKKLFSLQKTATDISVGVKCQRSSGGNLSFVGFEWTDLVLTSRDNATVSSWIDALAVADVDNLRGEQ